MSLELREQDSPCSLVLIFLSGTELTRRARVKEQAAVEEEQKKSKRLSLAEEELAKAKRSAEEAKSLAKTLEEKQRFRQVTPAQVAHFSRLVAGAPRGKVSVFIRSTEVEIAEYANQIRNMMTKEGYETGVMVGIGFGGTAPPGVLAMVRDDTNLPLHADAVVRALNAIGIKTDNIIKPDLASDDLEILVGKKPE